MEICSTIDQLRTFLEVPRSVGRTVGFVPTMGALHDGHRSLLERSADECDVTVLSIFVNPLQFGPGEDLDSYPRTRDEDIALADACGASVAFVPSVDEMYPGGSLQTTVRVGELAETLEGLSRPGHFDGVATVVTKLFLIVGPCRAYFGEKDWQQLTIIRQLVADLAMPVTITGCPTVRADDGLALSSRNKYLTDEQRRAAVVLHRALRAGVHAIREGVRSPQPVISSMSEVLSSEPLVEADYATVVDEQLRVPAELRGNLRLLVAARVGGTRLIDNDGVAA